MDIENFIHGEEKKSFSGYFEIKSPFFDYKFKLPNSSLVEVKSALSSAKKALESTKDLSFAEREQILKEAGRKLKFNNGEIEHIVKMTGMPRIEVIKRLKFVKYIFRELPKITEARYGRYFDTIVRPIFDLDLRLMGYEAHLPSDKIISAFIPPNDPAEPAFVLAHTVIHGGSIILKPSSLEPYMSLKLAKLLTECGYPKGSLNILHWDTRDLSRKKLSDEIAKNSGHRIFFGDIESFKSIFSPNNLIDGKNCIFTAGNSKIIVDTDVDLDSVVEKIIESAYGWTIDCISAKSVFVSDKNVKEELVSKICAKIKKLRVDNPLKNVTNIGYVENAYEIATNLEGGVEFNYGKKIHGSVKHEYQISPYLLETDTVNFPALHKEYPYTLTIFETANFDETINAIRKLSNVDPNNNFMTISIFIKTKSGELDSENLEKIQKLIKLPAYIININKPTTDLNLYLRHQDEFLTERITKVLNINI